MAHNHLDTDGNWLCLRHRYPPCSVCGTAERPRTARHSKQKLKEWTCSTCNQPTSSQASERQCSECLQCKSTSEFDRYDCGNIAQRCRACLHPRCTHCGATAKTAVRANEKIDGKWYCAQNQCQGQIPLQCGRCKEYKSRTPPPFTVLNMMT